MTVSHSNRGVDEGISAQCFQPVTREYKSKTLQGNIHNLKLVFNTYREPVPYPQFSHMRKKYRVLWKSKSALPIVYPSSNLDNIVNKRLYYR